MLTYIALLSGEVVRLCAMSMGVHPSKSEEALKSELKRKGVSESSASE